jgi:hypothetical protein
MLVLAGEEITRLREDRAGLQRALRGVMRVLINDADHSAERQAAAGVLDLISSGQLRALKDSLCNASSIAASGSAPGKPSRRGSRSRSSARASGGEGRPLPRRSDLPLISESREPVQRARESGAAKPPFPHRFDVTLAISPQTRERERAATARPQGLPLASADKRNGRPRLRPTVEAPWVGWMTSRGTSESAVGIA